MPRAIVHVLSAGLALASLTSRAMAQSEAEPLRIVRALYAPYLAGTDTGSALDLIKPHAAPDLRRLIAREEACMKKRQGICNIEADVLTESQDPQVKSVQTTTRDVSDAAVTVRVAFRHVGATKTTIIDIPFVRTGDKWLIVDVRGVSSRSSLTRSLRQPAP